MLGSCINVSQKNNLVIIKINENARYYTTNKEKSVSIKEDI